MGHNFPADLSKGKEKLFVMEPKLCFQDRHMTIEDSALKEPEVAYALAFILLSPKDQEILNRVDTSELV